LAVDAYYGINYAKNNAFRGLNSGVNILIFASSPLAEKNKLDSICSGKVLHAYGFTSLPMMGKSPKG
jgi:hypothetical protein